MMRDLRNSEMKLMIDCYALNRHMEDLGFHWEDDVFTDGEIEYQVRDYTDEDFCSILVRFCDDKTHSYREFFAHSYDDEYTLMYDAFDDDVIEQLGKMMEEKVLRRRY